MDPGILVPPNGYGGIERIVEMLAKEYHRMGHEVHLLVTKGSFVEGCVMHPFGKEGFPPKKMDAWKAIPVAWKFLWKHRNDFDLVHSFGRLLYLLPILNLRVKKIMSYQREISTRNIKWINRLPNKNIVFTGCSHDLVSRGGIAGKWATVYNAVDFNIYTLRDNLPEDAPIIFLGRIERIKGCHTAIEVAKATNKKLIIAGNISKLPDEIDYYEKEIKPGIDGKQVIFIGEVNDIQKNEWLGKAQALIMPVEWNEPFGIVMIEAMACGTPVLGFNRGSVPEVIKNGISGFISENIEEMIKQVYRCKNIDRIEVRKIAEKKFNNQKITNDYLALHSSVINVSAH